MKLLILLIIFSPCLVKAETKFIVYQVRGNVSFTQNHVTSALKIGQSFTNINVVIHVSYNSSAILICNDYSLISLKQSNTYSLLKLVDSCKTPVSSVSSIYFRFVWDELTTEHGSIEENRRKYMHNVGAVTRGCPWIKFFTNYDTINYSNGFFPIKWVTTTDETDKIVFYKNETAEKRLLSVIAKNDSISLSVLKDSLKITGEYYWNIQSGNAEACARKYLKLWDDRSFRLLRDSILNSIPVNISEAEKLYILAFILEYNYFYAESYTYYKLAFEKDPSNLKYQNSLQLFIKVYFHQ